MSTCAPKRDLQSLTYAQVLVQYCKLLVCLIMRYVSLCRRVIINVLCLRIDYRWIAMRVEQSIRAVYYTTHAPPDATLTAAVRWEPRALSWAQAAQRRAVDARGRLDQRSHGGAELLVPFRTLLCCAVDHIRI